MKKHWLIVHFLVFMMTSLVALSVFFVQANNLNILTQDSNFTYGEILVIRPNSLLAEYRESPATYVIMDRNLGASEPGTGENSYGYRYQFGNNYGFEGEQSSNNILRPDANVNLSLYSNSNPYYSGVFVFGKDSHGTTSTDWATTSNDDIWGGEEIKESERQGPCPEGWHIPTISEWSDVVAYWTAQNGGMNVANFVDELKLPLAGGITRSWALYENKGTVGYFRTTSNYTQTLGWARAFKITDSTIDDNFGENRANGYSIRCFKDDDTIYTITYNDGVNDDDIFVDQSGTGMRGDYFPSFVGGYPEWDGDDDRDFMGWYMEKNGEYVYVDPLNKQITSNTTLYAKWSVCEEGECVVPPDEILVAQDMDIYFAVNDSDTRHYTLMDRNLGATEPGTGVNSYGNLFQWGNNHGFSNTGYLPNKSKSAVNTSVYGPGNYYYSSTFIYNNNDWSNPRNHNLWGDTTDMAVARQGPCPSGYHVPSSGDWLSLYNSWYSVNGDLVCSTLSGCIEKIKNDLLLPAVGRIDEKGKIGLPDAASYWSSSHSNSKGGSVAYGFYLRAADKEKNIQPNNEDYRARARSVRCVKNIENTPLTINLSGGVLGAVSIYGGKLHYLTDPTKTGFIFAGWYANSALTTKIEDGSSIGRSTTALYAKWNEADDVEYTFQANGGLFQVGSGENMAESETFVQTYSQGDTFDLSQVAVPTKECHIFNGRYDATQGGNEIQFPIIVSTPITVYAHWTVGECAITTDVVGSGNITISPAVGPYTYGSTVIFTAVPGVGYSFDKWTKNGDEILSGGNLTLNVMLTGDIHLTGYFVSSNVPQHIVSISSNNMEYGSVSETSLVVDNGTSITISGNILSIGSTVVVATPSSGGAQYTYIFTGRTSTCEGIVTEDCTITASFQRILREYMVTWQNYDGYLLETDTGVVYGSIPEYNGQTPIKPSDEEYNYVFVGWYPDVTGIVEDVVYTAVFSGELIGCQLGYHREDGDCVANTKYIPCIEAGAPANASYLSGDILVFWDGSGRSVADSCNWSCDENYHEDGDNCVLDTYVLTFISSGGIDVLPRTVDYGSIVILPGTNRTGYHFLGWYMQGGDFVGVSGTNFVYDMTGDITLYAGWEANTGTRYTVRHWLQNADDDLYNEVSLDQQIQQGPTDTFTQATANYYTGFQVKPINQLPISGDETTVVDVYYDREVYTIIIDLNGGTGESEVTGKYGQTMSQPDIARSGYTLKKYVPDFPATMPLNGTSVKAIWTLTNGGVSIRIVPLTGDDFNFGSVVASNKVQMLTGYLGENSFQLEDTRGENSGYYVTLSISTLNSVNTQNSIARSNIQLRSHGVTTITGAQASEVGISPQLLSWTTMDNTVLYLIRPNIVVEDDPLIGIYGDNLEFKVLVPPYTYPDRYKAVITYTLYDNDDE